MEQLTVEENILLASQLADSSGVEQQKRIKELLGKLGLRGKEKRKVNKLSGGERQRVAFARALINNPEIIIADEPTSALDKNNKKGIMKLISQLAEERTVVLVTHDEIDIPVNANIYRLMDGKITQENRGATEIVNPSENYKKNILIKMRYKVVGICSRENGIHSYRFRY